MESKFETLRNKVEHLSTQLVAANKELEAYRRGMTIDALLEQENKNLKEQYAYRAARYLAAENKVRILHYRNLELEHALVDLRERCAPPPEKSEEQRMWEDAYDNIYSENTRKALLTLMQAVSE